MSNNMDGLNRQKILDILRVIWKDNHRFTDIHNELDWSKATISKYLQALQDRDIIEKGLTSSDNVGYFLTEEGEYLFRGQNLAESFSLDLDQEDIIERSKKQNKLLEDLEKSGLFSTGMDMNDVESIMKKYPEEFSIDFNNKITALKYRQFILFLVRMLEPEIWDREITAEIKIDEDNPDSLKNDVKSLKQSMEELDWP